MKRPYRLYLTVISFPYLEVNITLYLHTQKISFDLFIAVFVPQFYINRKEIFLACKILLMNIYSPLSI